MSAEADAAAKGDLSLACLGIFVDGGDSELLVSLAFLARLFVMAFVLWKILFFLTNKPN